jgi:hypothetical protein
MESVGIKEDEEGGGEGSSNQGGGKKEKNLVNFDKFVAIFERGMPGGHLMWWSRLQRRKISMEVFKLIDVDGSGI